MKPGAIESPRRSIASRAMSSATRLRDAKRCGPHRSRCRRRSRAAGAVEDGGVAQHDVDHSRASPPDVTYRSQRPHGAELSTSVTPSPYRHPRARSPAIAARATPGMRTRAVVAPSSAARPIDASTAGARSAASRTAIGPIDAVGLDVGVADRPAISRDRVCGEAGHRGPELVVLGTGGVERRAVDVCEDVRRRQSRHQRSRSRPAVAGPATSRSGSWGNIPNRP